VGIPGPETERIHRCIESEGLGQNVALLSGISEAELQWCYRSCEALLAPSLMEGFGLPVAEGLLAGCRIVCSDILPFRELGGEHCSYFALGENEEAAFGAAIRSALKQPRKRPVAMPQISGEVIAGEYMSLYQRLLESTDKSPLCVEREENRSQAIGAC
jgi:glycosyltransferase involved in cell wall biosynthesis